MAQAGPYSSTIIEHFRRPRNQGPLPNASSSAEVVNALCGDRVRVSVLLDGGTIADARFVANACAICVASASLLTERIRRAARDEAARMTEAEVLSLIGDGVPAGRTRCATLPLEALRRALGTA